MQVRFLGGAAVSSSSPLLPSDASSPVTLRRLHGDWFSVTLTTAASPAGRGGSAPGEGPQAGLAQPPGEQAQEVVRLVRVQREAENPLRSGGWRIVGSVVPARGGSRRWRRTLGREKGGQLRSWREKEAGEEVRGRREKVE